MPKISLSLALVVLAGCAGAPPVSTSRTAAPYAIEHVASRVTLSPADSARLQLGENGNADVVPLPVDRAWTGLVRSFPALGLEVTQTDPVGRALAGRRYRSRRPFGGRSFADLMSCGETAGIPNAARWDVTLQVATRLVPYGHDSTIVATWVLASAKPSGTAGDEADCVVNEKIAAIVAGTVAQQAAESPSGQSQ